MSIQTVKLLECILIYNQMINFENYNYNFKLKKKNRIRRWIKKTIKEYNFEIGDISYFFTSDEELLEINKQYLHHDYYTDIITFNYNEENIISAEIFISIERIKDNSEKFNTTFQNELHRVIIHGILHLLGFDDKTEDQKNTMRKLEDKCLSNLNLK